MAHLIETPQWTAGIYQLEEDDPVLGGENGIDNLQAKQLANRTAWLKQGLEAVGDEVGDLPNLYQPKHALLAALSALVLAPNRLVYATGSNTLAASDLTAFARTLLAATTDTAARGVLGAAPMASPALTGSPTAPTAIGGTNSTQIATTAFVQSALAALVNSAPGALDTLNELATALGNDPNFATTINAALAAKAPLASPAFSATPTAPTAAGGTNTTQLATTAFVQAAIASLLSVKFPHYLGSSGYYGLPDGFYFQWGVSSFAPNSTTTVTLPVAFPNQFIGVVTTVRDNVANVVSNPIGAALPLNNSSFSMRSYYSASSLQQTYLALGY